MAELDREKAVLLKEIDKAETRLGDAARRLAWERHGSLYDEREKRERAAARARTAYDEASRASLAASIEYDRVVSELGDSGPGTWAPYLAKVKQAMGASEAARLRAADAKEDWDKAKAELTEVERMLAPKIRDCHDEVFSGKVTAV
jgi:hypothetical protein